MLNKIYAVGLVKSAGNEKEALEFVEGFLEGLGEEGIEKLAMYAHPDAKQRMQPANEVVSSLSESLGKGMGSVAISAGVGAVGHLYNSLQNVRLKTQFHSTLETAIKNTRLLQEAPKDKVMSFGETVFRFAPHVATDVNLLSMVLSNAIHGDSMDPATLQTLSNLESKYKENTGFSPRTFS